MDFSSTSRGDLLAVNAIVANTTLLLDANLTSPTRGSVLENLGVTFTLDSPQGVCFGDNIILVADADGIVHIFNTSGTHSIVEMPQIDLVMDADNVRLESGRFYVGYGDVNWFSHGTFPQSGIVEINATSGLVGESYTLPAHAESFQLSSDYIYVNTPDANSTIQVIDRKSRHVVKTWQLCLSSSGGGIARDNYPMALVPTGNAMHDSPLLLVGFRNPPILALLDGTTGSTISVARAVSDMDDIWIANENWVLATGGGGSIDMYQLERTNKNNISGYSLVNKSSVPTSPMARTSLCVEERGLLFVAVPKDEALGNPRVSGRQATPTASIQVYSMV